METQESRRNSSVSPDFSPGNCRAGSLEEELIAERDLMEFLGVSKDQLLKMRHRGLPHLKCGMKVYFFEDQVREWLRKNVTVWTE